MQALFTYGGSRKSALSPMTITLGAFSSVNKYDADLVVGRLPLPPSDAAALVNSGDIATVRARIAELTKYEAEVRSYYDKRVSRTSGGKRDRMRNERRDLTGAANESLAILRSGLQTLERAKTATVTAARPDFDPSTGKTIVTESSTFTPETSVTDSSSEFKASSLIIPVGAALAALYFLKGH